MSVGAVAKGIDISSHQGEIDFQKVKDAGYSYVIIKAGQGLRQMGTFRDKYLPAVLAAGLEWGAYWWSDAVSVSEAKQEAQAFIKVLTGLKPTYPVYMDQEYESPCGKMGRGAAARQLRTDMAKAFLSVLEDAGYYAGLYCSTDWFHNWICNDQLSTYDKWVAQYAGRCTYTGDYGMWQHHGDVPGFVGRAPGISVPVDLNDCYRDYPAIIKTKGFNGWSSIDVPEDSDNHPDYKAMYEDSKTRYNALCGELSILAAKYAVVTD